MFETVGGGGTVGFDAPLDVDDVPSWSDEQYDVWVAELIAADPDGGSDGGAASGPSLSEVWRAAESGPVTGELLTRLAAVELAAVDDDAALSVAIGLTRVANRVAALRA